MSEHAEASGSDYFVKGEAEIRLQPSPEQELQLVEDEERNEDGSEQPDDGARNCAVADDRGGERREQAEQHLRNGVDQNKIRLRYSRYHAGAAFCCA